LAKGFRTGPFNQDYTRDIVKGETYFRPKVPVRLQNDSKKFPTSMLVDSGADLSMIPFEIAELLELKLGEEKTNLGPNGKFSSRRSSVEAWLYLGKKETFLGKIPVLVPSAKLDDTGDIPYLCLLGRHPFFEFYDITFLESKLRIHFQPSSQFGPAPPPPSNIKSDK
jgi:hypothetical protein